MGSPINQSMLRPGHAVAICVLALLTIGVVMVNSAGMTIHAREPFTIEAILLSRTTVYAGLAMLALIACSMLPLLLLMGGYPGSPSRARADGSRLGEPGYPEGGYSIIDEPILSPAWFRAMVREYVGLWPLWAGAFGLLALLASVYVPGIRSPKNGSHRWINLHLPGLESVQPSELAKWGLVLLIAAYAAISARRMRSFWVGLVPGLIATGLVAGFVVIEDLGTGALMVLVACVVLVAAGARLWHLLILCPVPLAGAALAIVTNPYRVHRIESFMNPFLDPQGKGFHMIQSMVSVANGQVFGRGLGGGLQKFGYLPEDTTDFIFATICEELGIAGAAIVLFLLGALIWSVWGIVRKEENALLKLVGLGVMGTVGIQAAINLAVVTGLGPTKGIALPLISSGGTGWILTAGALGLVVAMDRAQFRAIARAAMLNDEPIEEPDGYAIPALGAMAMSAAAATAVMSEIKPEPQPEPMVAMQSPSSPSGVQILLSPIGAEVLPSPIGAQVLSRGRKPTESDPLNSEAPEGRHSATSLAHNPADEGGFAQLATQQIIAAAPEPSPIGAKDPSRGREPTETDPLNSEAPEGRHSAAPLAQNPDDDSIASMFEGSVIAEPPPIRDLPAIVQSDPIIELKSQAQVFPGLSGQTETLFGPHVPTTPTPPTAPKPEIVVTDHAKNWLTPTGEESAA